MLIVSEDCKNDAVTVKKKMTVVESERHRLEGT
jgi:hypothetical protein